MKLKRLLCAALAATIGMSVAACGTPSDVKQSSTANSETSSTQTTDGKTQIVVWTFQRHDMDYVTAMLDEYNKTNTDNIEVKLEVMSENFDTNLDLAFQSNQMPDVFRARVPMMSYIQKDMVSPIDEFMTDEEKALYGDTIGVERLNAYDGKLYTLPYTGSAYRLIYNKDIFEKAGLDPEAPPKTLSEVREMSKIITEKLSGEGIYGTAMNLKSPSSGLNRSVDVIAEHSGVYPYNDETGKYDFTGYGEILKVYADIYADGSFFPGAEGLDIDPLRAQFAQGKIGMYLSGDWEIGVYADQFPTDINWAAAELPVLDGSTPQPVRMSGAGYGWCISSQTKNPEAAWKVMQLFHDFDFQVGYSESGYGFMTREDVVAAAKPAEKYGSEYFVPGEMDTIKAPPPHSSGVVIEGDTFNDMGVAVILGQKDADQCVQELNEKYNAALEKAKAEGKY